MTLHCCCRCGWRCRRRRTFATIYVHTMCERIETNRILCCFGCWCWCWCICMWNVVATCNNNNKTNSRRDNRKWREGGADEKKMRERNPSTREMFMNTSARTHVCLCCCCCCMQHCQVPTNPKHIIEIEDTCIAYETNRNREAIQQNVEQKLAFEVSPWRETHTDRPTDEINPNKIGNSLINNNNNNSK